jgi:hypothetical protein
MGMNRKGTDDLAISIKTSMLQKDSVHDTCSIETENSEKLADSGQKYDALSTAIGIFSWVKNAP